MTRVANTLTRWPFIAALTILLLNDFWLKSQFPGFITGKISDFAGIALVALPLLAAFPRRARAIYLGLAAAFLWWKSPLSAPFIAFANDVLPYRIDRVVDYTDLFALLVLPFCSLATREVCIESGRLRRSLTMPVIAVAVFATAATSMPRPQAEVTMRNIDRQVSLDRAATADAIDSVMKAYRLECVECAERERKGSYRGRDVYVVYHFPADDAVHLQLSWVTGFLSRDRTRLAMRIKQALKDEFTARFRGMEAVEPLRNFYEEPPPPPCVSEAEGAPHCTDTGQVTQTEAPP